MENIIKTENQNIIKIETEYQGLRSALQQVEGLAKSGKKSGRDSLGFIRMQLKENEIKLLSSDATAILESSIIADYPTELEGKCFYFKHLKLKSKKGFAEIKIISERMEIRHISTGEIEVISLENPDSSDIFGTLETLLHDIEKSEIADKEINFDQNLLNTTLGKYKAPVTIKLLEGLRMFVKTAEGTGAGFASKEKETQGVTIRVAICGLRK